ncbi:hypothetical protein Sjap_000697 [Stephania japonica]|uniref:Uncharacterized protein n=1 Tax=Stephania japonica TaxID=461633 RepID=A0AAP0PR05_9MAGN
MLSCLVAEHPKQWDLSLPQAEFAFNSKLNRSTGYNPFMVVYTKVPLMPMDLIPITKPAHNSVSSIAEWVSKLHSDVTANLQATNAHYKALADKHRRLQTFLPGNLVMVHLNKHRLQQTPNAKLHPRKLGPSPSNKLLEITPTS